MNILCYKSRCSENISYKCTAPFMVIGPDGSCNTVKAKEIALRAKPVRDPSVDPCMCGTQRCYPDSCDAYQEHQQWLHDENLRKLEQGRC